MSKKEIEQIKEELREEIKREIQTSLENNRNKSYWQEYMASVIRPLLDEKMENGKEKYGLITALNTIARVHAKKRHVRMISQEELEEIKPIIENIIEKF